MFLPYTWPSASQEDLIEASADRAPGGGAVAEPMPTPGSPGAGLVAVPQAPAESSTPLMMSACTAWRIVPPAELSSGSAGVGGSAPIAALHHTSRWPPSLETFFDAACHAAGSRGVPCRRVAGGRAHYAWGRGGWVEDPRPKRRPGPTARLACAADDLGEGWLPCSPAGD